MNDKKLEKKIVNNNYDLAADSHLTPKTYVDSNIDETPLVRNKNDN